MGISFGNILKNGLMFKNTIIFLNGSLKTLFINVKKKLYLCRLI